MLAWRRGNGPPFLQSAALATDQCHGCIHWRIARQRISRRDPPHAVKQFNVQYSSNPVAEEK
jgi:hypothetical protein